VTVDECGRVINAEAVSGPGDLKDAAVRAARRWRFTPTKLVDRPVKVIGTIAFNFNL
jgi:TonB family protein